MSTPAPRCFWTERTASQAGTIIYGGIAYRPARPLPAGSRVNVIGARGGRLLFERGGSTCTARREGEGA